MKAKELMIGNWVMCNVSTHPCVALGICDDKVKIGNNWFSEEDLSPVPIVPETLEKNSFSDVDNSSINLQIGFVHWYHVDRIGALEDPLITQDLNSGTYSLVYRHNQVHGLRYVHELQHAFRLFWLNDLADKFTV